MAVQRVNRRRIAEPKRRRTGCPDQRKLAEQQAARQERKADDDRRIDNVDRSTR
jgi:hypothetical protein